ncbi:hypothetical protein, partial [Alteribacillus sp. HJP-4]|uniref:hypothetical protein n=1 Tax=Alteribacillus sp. HJP-4 TaxID=2775394 RepID=UPI0035CCD86D
MPNTEVKLFSADDNEGATLCESRTLPGTIEKAARTSSSGGFFVWAAFCVDFEKGDTFKEKGISLWSGGKSQRNAGYILAIRGNAP